MSADQMLAFFLFALVAAVTPGPSNLLLAATGARAGLWRGLPCLCGVSAGMASLMFLAACGLGGLLLAWPWLLQAVRLGGAAFLLWLAWTIATVPVPGGGDGAPVRGPGQPVGFLGAAALQWVNPKAWLVSAGAVATYQPVGAGIGILAMLPAAAVFAAIFVLAALPSGLVWLAFGAAAQRLLRSPRHQRVFNVAMGATLAASVAMILV